MHNIYVIQTKRGVDVLGTYRNGEVNRRQGETRRLVDVPQKWASLDSLLDNITLLRALAESSFEKGIHVNSSSSLACEFVKRAKCEHL
jgi:hypothetical protein